MKIADVERFLTFQMQALDYLDFLIKYDKEQAEKTNLPAEKTITLKAFCDSQRKSLELAKMLLTKHMDSLQAEEKRKEKEKNKKLAETAKIEKAQQAKVEPPTKQEQADNSDINLFDSIEKGDKK